MKYASDNESAGATQLASAQSEESPSPSSNGSIVECTHAVRCGGCPSIALSYDEQLTRKHTRVVDSLSRYGELSPIEIAAVAPATPNVGYRTRAKLVVAPGARIGLYAKGGGHQVVDIPQCKVLSPALLKVTQVLRDLIRKHEELGGPLTPFAATHGSLRAVDLREAKANDGTASAVLATFVVQRSSAVIDDLRLAAKELRLLAPEVVGVAASFHSGESPQVLGDDLTVLDGASHAIDSIGHSLQHATFGSFVQAHRNQSHRVHDLVVEAVRSVHPSGPSKKPRVLDLFGGSGAISMAVARAGADVHLVENFAPAVAQAKSAAATMASRHDAKLGPIGTFTAECLDAATGLQHLSASGASFDIVVVNPPRRGLAPAVREGIARLSPGRLVYVSCDPSTLGRDLAHLARLGWQPRTVNPLDMIPLTDEVETVVVLDRAPPARPHVLFESDDIVIVEKSAHEPTMPQGEYTRSLLERARLLPRAETATPIHRLDVGTSGIVVLGKTAQAVQKWAVILNSPSTRKVYVTAVRGITPGKGAISRSLREDGAVIETRSRYRRLAIVGGHSVLRIVPENERSHQVRRHLAAIGHPVLGDERYGHMPTNRYFEEKNGLDRCFLHCVRIEFDEPQTGSRCIVESPLPGDLRSILERSGGPETVRFLEQKQALGQSSYASSLPPPPDAEDGIEESGLMNRDDGARGSRLKKAAGSY